jgi:hypothetical protein
MSNHARSFLLLQVSLAIVLDIRQRDQEDIVRNPGCETEERRAADLLGGLHQQSRHPNCDAACKIGRREEPQFEQMAVRQGLVGVSLQPDAQLERPCRR